VCVYVCAYTFAACARLALHGRQGNLRLKHGQSSKAKSPKFCRHEFPEQLLRKDREYRHRDHEDDEPVCVCVFVCVCVCVCVYVCVFVRTRVPFCRLCAS
jgi:hypothetical protein